MLIAAAWRIAKSYGYCCYGYCCCWRIPSVLLQVLKVVLLLTILPCYIAAGAEDSAGP
jgi:hypothetical protein